MQFKETDPSQPIQHTGKSRKTAQDLMAQIESLNKPDFTQGQTPVESHTTVHTPSAMSKPYQKPLAPVEDTVSVKEQSQVQNSPYVDVPSGLIFYPYQIKGNAIALRDVLYRELVLLSTAQETGSVRSQMEAMNATILNMDGMQMTYGDMQFVMYHHRTSLKRPFTIEWTCSSEKHRELIDSTQPEHDYITEETLKNTKTVQRSNLKIIYPDIEQLKKLVDSEGRLLVDGEPIKNLLEEYLYVCPVIVSTVIEIAEEMDSVFDSATDENAVALARELSTIKTENEFAANIAKVPNSTNPTLQQRRDYFNNWMGNLPQSFELHSAVLKALKQYAQYSNHGVDESVTCTCEVCGSKQDLMIRFNPADFFPEV